MQFLREINVPRIKPSAGIVFVQLGSKYHIVPWLARLVVWKMPIAWLETKLVARSPLAIFLTSVALGKLVLACESR